MAFTLVLALLSVGQPNQMATKDGAPPPPWSYKAMKNMEAFVILLQVRYHNAFLQMSITPSQTELSFALLL